MRTEQPQPLEETILRIKQSAHQQVNDMKEISNSDYYSIITKLPGVLAMARNSSPKPTLRQSEDIRMLSLTVKRLTRKNLAANR